MGCIVTVLGILAPRLLILFGWASDPVAWGSAFGSPIWPVLGFLFLPWTTFFHVLFAQGGLDAIKVVFLVMAVVADMATWGGGFLGNRKRISNSNFRF